MNKNDFYKQLMSEYSFDCDKIKSNAKKGRFAKQRALPMYIGMTAAAAVMVVAVGTTVFTAIGNGDPIDSGVVLTGGNDSVLTPNERFIHALDELQENAQSSEPRDVMVTFSEPLSPAEARAVLTAGGDIPVKKLYFADGTSAFGETEVEAGFGGDRQINGAIVNCAGYVMASLNGDSRVFLVENVLESDINTIAPIDTNAVDGIDGIDGIEGSTVNVPEHTPAIPDDIIPNGTGGESADSSGEAPGGVETTDRETNENLETTDNSSAESSDSSEPVSPETSDVTSSESTGTTESTPTVDIPQPPQTTPDIGTSSPQNPETPVIQPEKLPDGVTLPESIDRFSYETIDLGAKEAFFMSDTTFFVRTPYQIQMYSFNGTEERLLASEDCDNAEVCWISENGGSIIVSATGDNGKRNRLLYLSADSEQITDLSAIDTVMDGTLKGVGYNVDSGLLVMNILENNRYYVCAVKFSGGNTNYLSTCFESDSPVTLMAANGMNVYLAVKDGALVQIYEVNAETNTSRLIKTYENNPRIYSNLAFTHGIIYPSSAALTGSAEIFDPQTRSFMTAGGADISVDFGTNKHSFMVNGSCYSISGGSIGSAGGTTIIGRVDYKKSASSLYAAAVSGGKVRITESRYNAKVRNGDLIFGDLSDSVSADIRAAVNGALAVNNLIVQGSYDKCGVNSPGELSQCIDCYYSESAANALRNKCGISPMGAVMKYNGAGLVSANVSDTILTVSTSGSTASGILYVKAGNFGGKTAYVSYSVKLVNENGRWQVDCILGN
ncbi:MAG: hypothetical protein K2O14_01025 [Oscillospiraceae bacterium]|nr:hypothetical protein [Oscillospiraceae bacterium]